MAMSFAGDLDTLINYASFAQWSQRACTMCALVWIRVRHKPVHPDAIRTPIVLPIAFAIVCIALIVIETIHDQRVSGVGFAALFGGFIIYFLFLYDKSLPSVKCYQRIAKSLNNAATVFTQVLLNVIPERTETSEFTESLLMTAQERSYTIDTTSSTAFNPSPQPPIATVERTFMEKTKRLLGISSAKVADVSTSTPTKVEQPKSDAKQG
ncbi:unnamed protein product [Toxocara canis]|nr:unnamed protein product [Toxocara canis]